MKNQGLTTALQLAQMDSRRIRQRYSVVLERTVCELNGESCIDLEETSAPKQQIMCSRSFGDKLTNYADLRECVCEFAVRAAEKLRNEGQLARMVHVFIRTSPFDESGLAPTTATPQPASSPGQVRIPVTFWDWSRTCSI
ncbi:MAG: hypothetical protein GW861_14895 [Deltaproteobacteria bacterium]|nr:hypothetical protein [Deltaproteobacteria bacterium]